MILSRVLLALSLFLGLATNAVAGDSFLPKLLASKGCWPECVGKYTCDDYLPKCAPCPKPVRCFTCDDYGRKCLPGARPVPCFTCDDYCRKPFTFFCRPTCHAPKPCR